MTDKLTPMRYPTKTTLKKYGLSLDDWMEMYQRQEGRCAICGKTPSSGVFHTDHKHVHKYKHLPDPVRRLYVRGLLCQFCNRMYMARNMTISKAVNIVAYLDEFEKKLNSREESYDRPTKGGTGQRLHADDNPVHSPGRTPVAESNNA